MTFAFPSLLWLALLAPAAAALASWLWRRRLAAHAAWASRGLWNRLLPAFAPRRLTLSVAALAVAVLGTSLALARPRWGRESQKVERQGIDVVFLVDSSLSMGAQDVSPSRLFVAKSLVRRMVEAMPGNRVGLVQTEGDGVVLAPLTLDGGVIDLLLDTIDPGSLPVPGTELATGLETALRLFGKGGGQHRALVILSDGEDHGGGLEGEIARLREESVVVFAVGIGTREGAPVPVPGGSGEVKRNADGSRVVSQLGEEVLKRLARASGGTYLHATSAATAPTPILRRIDRLEKWAIESHSLNTQEERFQWPLALAASALLLYLAVGPFASETARRAAGSVPRSPVIARASLLPTLLLLGWATWPSLPWRPHLPAWAERWLYNPRERTERALAAEERGDPRKAVGPADTALRLAPEDPAVQYNAGTAHLRAGHARQAAPLLERAAQGAGPAWSTTAQYNLGNARLAAGDAAGAVESYKRVLRAEPGNFSAKFNLELALQEEQKQRLGLGGRPAGARGNRTRNQDPTNQAGRGKTDQSQNRSRRQQPAPAAQQQGRQGESPQAGGEETRPQPFRDQPEMSAREASAVLAAVENLERQQRRDQAARRARQRAAKRKDW